MKVSKNVARVFSALMIIFVLCSALSPVVFADIKTNWTGIEGEASGKVENIGQQILGIVQTVAGLAAVILLIVLAIKYMTASPEGKADIKKTALIYVVGAALMFGTSWVLGMVKDLMTTDAGTT